MTSSARFMEMTVSSEAQYGEGYDEENGYASFAEEEVLISDMTSISMYRLWEYMKLFFSARMHLEDMFLYDKTLVPKGLRLGKQRVRSRESNFVVNAAERKVEVIENPHLEGAHGSTSLLLVSISTASVYLSFAYNWRYEGGFTEDSGLEHVLVPVPALLL